MLIPCPPFEVTATWQWLSLLCLHWMRLATVLVSGQYVLAEERRRGAQQKSQYATTVVLQACTSCLNIGHTHSTILFRMPEKRFSIPQYIVC